MTSPADNSVLALLSAEALERMDAARVDLPSGEIVLPPGDPIEYIYFPTTAIIGVIGHISNGRMVEVAICGRDGVAGGAALLGGTFRNPLGRIVQIPGEAYRVSLDLVRQEFDKGGPFQKGVLSFGWDFAHQAAMTVICCQFHTVEQRFVRWLLMHHDRLDTDTLPVTHEYIAQMLGANRTTITLAANRLQELGYIKNLRGRTVIVDRPGLEAIVCECYLTESS